MLTNFQMLRSFKYEPEHVGFCTEEEVKLINEHFEIDKRSDIELQNLRDFIVMYYARLIDKAIEEKRREDSYKLSDTMSAITGVIDDSKFKRGMEV